MPPRLASAAALLDTLAPTDRPSGALQLMTPLGAFEANPLVPLLVTDLGDAAGRADLGAMLRRIYPAGHPVMLLFSDAAPRPSTLGAALGEDAEVSAIGEGCAAAGIYVAPLAADAAERSLQGLRQLVHRLRAPGGCPWDGKQTPDSLTNYVIEEAYEVVDAIRAGMPHDVAEELGDLMLQVYLQAEIAEEAGDFTLNDVVEGLSRKLVRRHPHVFGDVQIAGASDVEANWDALKQAEKSERVSALDGVPRSLPALLMAQEIQKRLIKAGFDWPDRHGPEEKLAEELAELRAAETPDEVLAELGDVMFMLARLGLDRGANAEDGLRATIARVEHRYRHVEATLRERGLTPRDVQIDELQALWDDAKRAAVPHP